MLSPQTLVARCSASINTTAVQQCYSSIAQQNIKMKSFFNQLIILLIYTSLCLSQQCSNNQVYSDNERPSSCKHILANCPATPSGYYWLQSSDHSTSHKVYCDMENERCGSKGWTRVALLDMSDNTQSCPGDLTLISKPHTYLWRSNYCRMC